ncbi:MAG: hypothetical protein QOI34_232 [Verrucomicrobiota bacterium]
MSNLHTSADALFLLQIFVSLFLTILFLQSGIDKVVDRRGNLEWLTGHFAKSLLAGAVPLLFFAITVLEIAAGLLSAAGCMRLILTRDTTIGFYGAVVSVISITSLFLGQRLAKDYPGAAVLVPYFLVGLAGVYLFAQ